MKQNEYDEVTSELIVPLWFNEPKLNLFPSVIVWHAPDAAARSVDFPAFGTPKKPTSATRRSSTDSHLCDPGSPCSAILGALYRAVIKASLPRPPRPPRATSNVSPLNRNSPATFCVLRSRTTVPGGTPTYMLSPLAPSFDFPNPFFPLTARI